MSQSLNATVIVAPVLLKNRVSSLHGTGYDKTLKESNNYFVNTICSIQ